MIHRSHKCLLVAILAAFLCFAGCTTSPRQSWESLRGHGFPGWSEQASSGIRANKNAQPSGFFTDKKSDQIEQNLGGGF